MLRRYRLVILIGFFITYSLGASPVEFYSINAIHGISIRATSSICKDNSGFIWASSKTGILRLTDDDYRVYQLPYETSGALLVWLNYEHSKLTAYTNNGQVFQFNPVSDRFELLLNLGNFLGKILFDVYSVRMNANGDYWIALSTGLYKYHSGKLELIEAVEQERFSIDWFDQKRMIIAKTDGIWLLDTETQKNNCLYSIRDNTLSSVSSLYYDKSKSKLWIGTLSNGLFCYSFRSGTFLHVLQSQLPKQPILAIEENSDTTLLVGIDGQGIWELDKNSNQLLTVYKESADDPTSLRGNGVYDIFYDQGKRVWISTFSGGISYFDQASPLINQIVHQSNNDNSLVNSDVNAILEDREGKIWFATNNGISCWDPASDKWKSFLSNKLEQAQVFLTLCEDDQGRIWAGSYSSGVYVLDQSSGKELFHYARGKKGAPAISNYIFDIFKDSQGDLWIGGINGEFSCYLSKENRLKSYPEEPVSSFAELQPNQILLGCSYGILLLDKQTGEKKNLLSDIVVQDMIAMGEIIWVCTSGEGLLEYNHQEGSVKKYTTQSGLSSNFINSIVYAGGYLWLGTESGLCRFNPKDKTTLTFSSIFPLSNFSFNKSATGTLRNGKLAWGTNNGAVFFEPESLNEIPIEGRIFIQDLTIAGRSIREIPSFKLNSPVDSLNEINLKYFQNTINMELIPLGVPLGAKFAWKLEGFDTDWAVPSNNRMITYTNIPSGKFVLKIRMLDSSMTQVISERSVAIRLVPPFWLTGWFLALIIVILSTIILLYLLYYINSLKQKHTEEKVRFFTNTAHDIRTSLTLIKAPVEELIKEHNISETGKYYLQLANEQSLRLSAVVTQLMDYQKADIGKEQLSLTMTDVVGLVSSRCILFGSLAKNNHVELVFNSETTSYLSAVDEPKMEKIIDNLISNAIKYSHRESKVDVDLKCDDKKWSLQVKDSGIGISKKAQRQLFKEFYRGENAINSKVVGSGIGLLLVKNYVTLHGGTISCTSQENGGSLFQVTIPYKKVETANPSKIEDMAISVDAKNVSRAPVIQENDRSKDLKILIVEDNDDLRKFMHSVLGQEFSLLTAKDGADAWEIVRKQIPDLVVSDVMMPEMDGFELCRLMKSTYETSHIPIILLTALTEKAEQLHGLGLGADDYLTKPFDMGILSQRIKTIIRNREVIREKAFRLIKGETADPAILENEINDKFLKKILEVARLNLSNTEFSKDEFASSLNMSSSLLYKKTKSLTGLSPTDFIKTVRLDHALLLLQSRKYTVTEVSELCGFASVGYFSTVFKKHFGKSPTEIME